MTDMRETGPDVTPSPRRRRALLPVLLLLLLLGGVAGAALWVAGAAAGPTVADSLALREAVEVRSPDLTATALVVTDVGSTVAMAVLAVVTGGWLAARGRRADAVFVVGAMLGGVALFRGLKVLIDRSRPPELTRLVTETNESLPSGHATMATVVIGSLVALAWAGRTVATRVAMVSAAVLWIGAVGATRVYLGVHWFSDVVAGWLVGGTWLAVCVVAWRWWTGRSASPVDAPAVRSG
jgi:undecaprenyl-diphosphatase